MSFLYVLSVITVVIILFIWLYPPLGGRPSGKQSASMHQSPQFGKKQFQNGVATTMDMGFGETLKILWDFIVGAPNRKPSQQIPMQVCDPHALAKSDGITITWLGHSSLLLNWRGKVILIDPMFGNAPTPFPWFAGQRYSQGLPFKVHQLPTIDAVFFSHDHYDHLDYGTIRKIQHKVKQFFVPLGVSAHLERWGVQPERIEEHDWWDEFSYEGLTIACTPARHFSGRSLNDRNRTLWCSWVIIDTNDGTRLFYSGDSGYASHFADIGAKYGPFDWALIECGQYDLRWKQIHLMPEESVQAAIDVRAARMLPVHWAAFTLALHPWFDPAERVVNEAQKRNVSILVPQIGETVDLHAKDFVARRWWDNLISDS